MADRADNYLRHVIIHDVRNSIRANAQLAQTTQPSAELLAVRGSRVVGE